ncbi:MAG: hypothetical protein IKG58_01970 [Bacilli bacterium]|nr:hypothetical protein [Bacilli bacterium]MBR3049313.1 hypothetical protein [Bacilli bacterium]
MINKFIDSLKNSKEEAKKQLENLKNSKVDRKLIDLLSDVLDGKEINEKIDEDEIKKYIENENFTDEEIRKLDFVIFIINKSNIRMDESQRSLCDKIKKTIEKRLAKEKDISKLEKQIELSDKVIEDLSEKKHFERFDDLEELLNSIDMSNEDKLEVLKSITISNIHKSDSLEISNEELVPEGKVIKLFSNYGLDYNKLSDELKLRLRKNVNLENADDLLSLLKNKEIDYKDIYKRSGSIFVAFLCKSSSEIVLGLEKSCNKYGIDFKAVVKKCALVLYPNTGTGSYVKHKKYGNSGKHYESGSGASNYFEDNGASNYFEDNIEFLDSIGIDVKHAYEKNQKIFITNPDVLKRNYYTLTNVYMLNITDIGVGIFSSRAIENFDRYIEASPLGYDYINENNSFLCNSGELDILKIKFSEQEYPGELFKITSTGKLQKDKITVYDMLPNNPLTLQEAIGISETHNREKQRSRSERYGYIDIKPLDSIPSNVFNQKWIKLIERKNKYDEFTYMFNGTRISRPKVLRVCAHLLNDVENLNPAMIKYALAYNSILNDQDVDNIEDFQNALKKEKGKGSGK